MLVYVHVNDTGMRAVPPTAPTDERPAPHGPTALPTTSPALPATAAAAASPFTIAAAPFAAAAAIAAPPNPAAVDATVDAAAGVDADMAGTPDAHGPTTRTATTES